MLENYYNKKRRKNRTLFVSRGFVEDWAVPSTAEINLPMSSLPPFLRTLLVTDGTVTKSLEAFFWESIQVNTITQELRIAEYDLPLLHVDRGEQVLTREVELQGKTSKRIYATAFSTVRPQILPQFFRGKLLKGEIGIGVLIRESGLESYREIVMIGSGPNPDGHADTTENGIDLIHRTYCVYLGGEPALLITERFPLNQYS